MTGIGAPARARSPLRSAGRSAEGIGPSWARGRLAWRQPHWRRSTWELMAGEERIGSLMVRGTFRERTRAEGPAGAWEFRARWTGRVEIAPPGSRDSTARFETRWWGGGAITTASGFRYGWDRIGFWKPEHVLTNDSGFACIRFRTRASFSRLACDVQIEPPGFRIPELEALIMLGWRLLVMRRAHAH